MLGKSLKYLFFNLKCIINPYRTIWNYPHVEFYGWVFLNKCKINKNVKIYGKTTISNSTIESYTYVGGGSKNNEYDYW